MSSESIDEYWNSEFTSSEKQFSKNVRENCWKKLLLSATKMKKTAECFISFQKILIFLPAILLLWDLKFLFTKILALPCFQIS